MIVPSLLLVLGQVPIHFSPRTGGWPRGFPSRLPGLREIDGQPDVGSGSTRSRIGRVLDDGTFWIQPLILHEPPRLCTWDSSQIGFRSAYWKRKATALVRRRASGQFVEVKVRSHRREPWEVDFTTDVDGPGSFDLAADTLAQGFAYAKDRGNTVYQRIQANARAHHRGMFAR